MLKDLHACLVAASLALGVLAPPSALAAPAVELDPDHAPQRLLASGEAFVDATGQRTVEAVAADPGLPWQPLGAGAIWPLSRGKALWVRFTVRTEANPVAERWYLEVPYPGLDEVALFAQDGNGGWVVSRAGDTLPVAEWPVPHRHPVLPLAMGAADTRTLYVRIENSHAFSAPLQFDTESNLSLAEQRATLLLGLYFGLVALTALLSLVIAVTLRDRAFALFAATVLALGLTQAGMTGISGMHLWPHSPWWSDVAVFVWPVLAAGLMCAFAAAVIALKERARWAHRVLNGLAALSLPLVAVLLAADPSLRYRLMMPYVAACIPVLAALLVWALARGDRYAGWMLAGFLPVAVGAALPLARTAGLIPASFWTMHAMQIALAIQLPVLLVMLLHRSQQRRDYARRIQGLDRIDPATGLINAAVFRERLVRLIARSVRFKYRSAILMVDITNLDQIRRDFDRRAMEELPLRVAGRLLGAAREIDSVARLAEQRFGLLLEGPLRAEEVAEAAPRIVARCLMPFKDKPMSWAPQVRVAQGLIPKDGTDADHLIRQLEDLLEGAPADSRRAVFMVSKPNLPAPVPLTPSTY